VTLRQIDHYQITAKIGEGGMGVVYRALDTKLNRPVAIKFLSDDLADAAARRRFQREAQMASSLNHPHILTVYDVGEFEGRHYIVTEFIDGGTLRDWAKAENRSWRQIVELLTGVADGLAAAHAAGILHRDIKPANILVARNGYAKLADFGLAKLSESVAGSAEGATPVLSDAVTKPGVVVGTSPTCRRNRRPGRSSTRAATFSFGSILHELISGGVRSAARRIWRCCKPSFTGDRSRWPTTCPLACELPWRRPGEGPSERYQTMRELVVDLRRLARDRSADRPVPGASVAATSRSRTWRLAGAVGALALAAAVGWFIRSPEPPFENPLGTPSLRVSPTSQERKPMRLSRWTGSSLLFWPIATGSSTSGSARLAAAALSI
jgi:serine/threonine protein kinase